jgi:hypothetical protein
MRSIALCLCAVIVPLLAWFEKRAEENIHENAKDMKGERK